MSERVAGAPLIISKTQDALTEKQLVDWTEYKRDLLEWISAVGKDPRKAVGYSDAVVRQMISDKPILSLALG